MAPDCLRHAVQRHLVDWRGIVSWGVLLTWGDLEVEEWKYESGALGMGEDVRSWQNRGLEGR
jgi:hypothetical protein